MTTDAAESEIEISWRDHCRSAVRKFVMNAVVVDNEPYLPSRRSPITHVPSVAHVSDDGMGGADADIVAALPTEFPVPEMEDDQGHPLNIQAISDAFADQEIACAFVLPKETDPDEMVIRRVLIASSLADIFIIDWKLRNADHRLTLEILTKIAEKDVAENGRVRLICVYTGEPQTDEITRDAIKALEDGGLVFDFRDEEAGKAHGKHHCLQVVSKQDEAGVTQLPSQLVDAMTDLADGLLPAFSLAAVAAVRKNVHHIISRFPRDLDGAYVANRMITTPPGEVAELMRELFISECDTALGLEKVADNFIEPDKIRLWLGERQHPKTVKTFGKDKIKIDRSLFDILLTQGISSGMVTIGGNQKKFPEDKRVLISQGLHGDEGKAVAAECSFAKHVSLKREAFGKTKLKSEDGEWLPSLTLGTILRQNKGTEAEPKYSYFYCLTPACDTIRLMGEVRTFLFLEIEEKDKTNLIVAEEKGADKRLFIDPKPTNIRAFRFRGCEQSGRVKAAATTVNGIDVFLFKSAEEVVNEFLWLGEVRRNRANRDMANLNREWLRFGVKDSEYLRLAEKGKA